MPIHFIPGGNGNAPADPAIDGDGDRNSDAHSVGWEEALDFVCDVAPPLALTTGLLMEKSAAALVTTAAWNMGRFVPVVGWAVAGLGFATAAFCMHRAMTEPRAQGQPAEELPQTDAAGAAEQANDNAGATGKAKTDKADGEKAASEKAYEPSRRVHDLRQDLADAQLEDEARQSRALSVLHKTLEALWQEFDELTKQSGENPTPEQLARTEKIEEEVAQVQRQIFDMQAQASELTPAQHEFVASTVAAANADPAVSADARAQLQSLSAALGEHNTALRRQHEDESEARKSWRPAQSMDEWQERKHDNAVDSKTTIAYRQFKEAWAAFNQFATQIYPAQGAGMPALPEPLKNLLLALLDNARQANALGEESAVALKRELLTQRHRLALQAAPDPDVVARVNQQLRDLDAGKGLATAADEELLEKAAEVLRGDPAFSGSAQAQELARLQRRFSKDKFDALKKALADATAQLQPGELPTGRNSVRVADTQRELNAALAERRRAFKAFFSGLAADPLSSKPHFRQALAELVKEFRAASEADKPGVAERIHQLVQRAEYHATGSLKESLHKLWCDKNIASTTASKRLAKERKLIEQLPAEGEITDEHRRLAMDAAMTQLELQDIQEDYWRRLEKAVRWFLPN